MPVRPPSTSDEKPDPYAGRWLARLKDKVIGQGGTPEQARQAAKASQFKEKPKIIYMPTTDALLFSPLLEQVQTVLSKTTGIYLVGGAVRDAMLQRVSHDLDFAVSGNALKIARKVANALGGAYYRLDDEHQTGRVVLNHSDGSHYLIDFAKFRGENIEADLKARDFTINAFGVALNKPQEVLDPLGGVADLQAHKLRACSTSTFSDDPLRILRAIRFAAALQLHIAGDTRTAMRAGAKGLAQVSSERVRDELFRILAAPQPATSMRALDMLGILPEALPELADLKNETQSPPHVYDVWEHSLQTLQFLEKLCTVLTEEHSSEKVGNLHFGLTVVRLGRFRQQIRAHFEKRLNRERQLLPLLYLAALYHDIAKPQTRSVEEDGRIRFIDHENQGATIAAARAEALRLGNAERDRFVTIIRNHMRPRNMAHEEQPPSRRAIYRFFRDTGEAGVDVCLLSLADVLATYAATMPQDRLEAQLDVLRALLEGYWEQYDETVSPPALLDGKDLIKEFGLKEGPHIGILLEAIREAQAGGEVQSRGDALKLAEEWLASNDE